MPHHRRRGSPRPLFAEPALASFVLGLLRTRLARINQEADADLHFAVFLSLRAALRRRRFQPQLLDHIVEQLSSAPTERFSLLVLICARSLTDKHQFCPWIAHAKHDLLAPLLRQLAALAVANVLANQFQRRNRISNIFLSFRHY